MLYRQWFGLKHRGNGRTMTKNFFYTIYKFINRVGTLFVPTRFNKTIKYFTYCEISIFRTDCAPSTLNSRI